ncbi:hypothetical protein ACFL4S_00450 [bacterium]
MFTDEELLNKYGKNQENTPNKKYKWYMLDILNPDYNSIFNDDFWDSREIEIIRVLISSYKIEGWFIVRRVYRHRYLDVCIINQRS